MVLLWWGCQATVVGEQLGDSKSETQTAKDYASGKIYYLDNSIVGSTNIRSHFVKPIKTNHN